MNILTIQYSSINFFKQIQPKDLSGGPNAVSHVYLEVVSVHFSKATKIPLHYDSGFLFIQTDKSIYNSVRYNTAGIVISGGNVGWPD